MDFVISYFPHRYLGLALSALLVWGSIQNVGVTRAVSSRSNLVLIGRGGLLRSVRSWESSWVTFQLFLRVVGTGSLRFLVRDQSQWFGTNRVSSTSSRTFEYSLLWLLALLGRRVLVTADDLRLFYLGLELQSLALYVLAASARGSAYSTEAGLKYFRLGAFASGLLLLGRSLVYGYVGSTDYSVLAKLLSVDSPRQVKVGFGLRVSAVRFKLAAAPFHRWYPDVLEGSPTISSAFFASITKIAGLGALVQLAFGPFGDCWSDRQGQIVVRSRLSRGLGAVAAFGQRRRKRFLAYSAIGHRGYRLRGLASGSVEGVQATLRYIAIYRVGSVGLWSAVLSSQVVYLTDLAHRGRRQPALAAVFAISRFSRAGVPPRAGFLAKLNVFFSARGSELYLLAIFAVCVSVVGAYYYLRLIKIRYFERGDNTGAVVPVSAAGAWVRASAAFVTVFLRLNPSILVRATTF